MRFGAKIEKSYPPRGDLQQYRLEDITAFTCARCHEHNVAKLVATSTSDANEFICNRCYGQLVSEGGSLRSAADGEPVDHGLPDASVDPLSDKYDLMHVGYDRELGMLSGIAINDRAVEWTFHLRRENLSWDWCPIPPVMAKKLSGRLLELSIWRAGKTARPISDRQSVRFGGRDDHCRLVGITWPADVLAGTRIVARWDRWKNVRFSLIPLVPPSVVEGHLVRYAYDPRIMTRDWGLVDSPDREFKGVLLLTVRRLGLLDYRGRAMLPEAVLIRNAAMHSMASLPPDAKVRAAVKQLILEGDLTVERGSRSVSGYLRHPAQPGEREVELLCYTPERRKADQDDLRRAEKATEHGVRAHNVAGHLMYIGHLDKGASEEARAAYREDHSQAGLVGPHEIPSGYTYVRPHRRGR